MGIGCGAPFFLMRKGREKEYTSFAFTLYLGQGNFYDEWCVIESLEERNSN